jgi:hypothetical protein
MWMTTFGIGLARDQWLADWFAEHDRLTPAEIMEALKLRRPSYDSLIRRWKRDDKLVYFRMGGTGGYYMLPGPKTDAELKIRRTASTELRRARWAAAKVAKAAAGSPPLSDEPVRQVPAGWRMPGPEVPRSVWDLARSDNPDQTARITVSE